MTAILALFASPLARYAALALGIMAALGGIYTKGRLDGRASYKAKVERQIHDAITTGDQGRADALRRLDAGGLSDSWFRD